MTSGKYACLKILLVAVLATVSIHSSAQVYNYEDGEGPTPPDSVRGLYIGLNLGAYFANKNTARIYDGHGYRRSGEIIKSFTSTWLNQAIQGTPQAEDRTSTAMGLAPGEWIFTESDMPGTMTYSGSFLYGGHLRYMFSSDFGVFLELNGTNPVTVGEFTIQDLTASGTDPSQVQTFRKFGIRGEEQRLMVNAGLHRVMFREQRERQGKSTAILPYVDAGFNMTFVKFQENFIELGSQGNVDLMAFYNNQGVFQDNANVLTGVGFGGFAALGAQITIGRKFTIDMGYSASFETIKLGEVKELGIQHQLLFKAIYM